MDASERDTLADTIARHVADYRSDDIACIDRAAVLGWWEQFDIEDRPAILRETARILGTTYISQHIVKSFLSTLAAREDIVGANPLAFWQSIGFLRIQIWGRSQVDLLALLDEVLQEKFGLTCDSAHSAQGVYLYLDDVCCSGDRVANDITAWLRQNDIRNATIYVACMAIYRGGEYNAGRRMNTTLRERNCQVRFRPGWYPENRKTYAIDSQVFWPTHMPDDPYVDQWRSRFTQSEQFYPRPTGGSPSRELFTSEEARATVEQAFLKKGAYIYCPYLSP